MIDILHQKPLLGRQINWAHPLAKGLIRCWLFNEMNGDVIYDLTKQNNLISLNGEWQLDAVEIDETGYLSTPTPPFGSQGTISLSAEGVVVPAGSGKAFVTVDADFQLFRNSVDTSQSFYINGVQGIFTTPDLYGTGRYNLTVTWDDIRNIRQMFVDGVKLTNVTSAFSMPSFTSTFYIGNRGDTTRSNGSRYYSCYIYNKVLSDEGIYNLHREPYAMFQQNRARWAVAGVPPAVGAITVLAAAYLNSRRRLKGDWLGF